MLRLSAWSRREDCQVANARSTGPQQQNTDDQNGSDDNAERSTSADRRTAHADDQKRRRLSVYNCVQQEGEPPYRWMCLGGGHCYVIETWIYECVCVKDDTVITDVIYAYVLRVTS